MIIMVFQMDGGNNSCLTDTHLKTAGTVVVTAKEM